MTEWKPIESAPLHRKILGARIGYDGWPETVIVIWNSDQYARKPRPFFALVNEPRVGDQREMQPYAWAEIPAPPTPDSVHP